MTIGELILAISTSIGGSAAILAILGYLSKGLLSNLLSKDLEVFKANLQKESQREMAHLKSSLELIAFEHQVRISKLHEKRAGVIATIYSKIDDLYTVVFDFVRHYPYSNESSKDQK